MQLSRSIRAAALATLIGLVGVAPVFASIIPQYDMTLTHTRAVTGQGSHADTFYNMTPIYLQIPPGSFSNSTPNVIGNTAYQYTFSGGTNGSGTGYLSAISIPSNATMASWLANRPENQNYVVKTATYSGGDSVITFPFSTTKVSQNEADGQDSLTTGPYASDTGAGTLYAGSTAYQAIAVGHQLYAWADGTWPTGSSSLGDSVTLSGSVQSVAIKGNGNNTDYQVDTSPLITPPVPVPVKNSVTGATTTDDFSVAVAASWDGGAVAMPLGVPSGDQATNQHYFTTQLAKSGGIGTTAYPNSTAAITSDPTWIGSADGLGNSVVAFGIASTSGHPRVVLWNVVTGAYKTLGVGTIAGAIWDATLYDSATQTLYVQDQYGNLYAFSTTDGALEVDYLNVSGWTKGTPEYPGALTIAKELALDHANNTLYAVGDGNDLIGAFNLNLTIQCGSGSTSSSGVSVIGKGGACQEYPEGPNVNSPAVLTDSNGDNTTVFDNEQGQIWLENTQDLLIAPSINVQDSYKQTARITDVGSSYIGLLPDAGTNGDLIGWTNDDPSGNPALVVFIPTTYSVAVCADASAEPGCYPSITVAGDTTINLTAALNPIGITAVSNGNTNVVPGSGSPVAYTVTGPGGTVVAGVAYAHASAGTWTSSWTTPANTTGTDQTYTITTTAVDELDQSATATTTVTVLPEQPPPVTNSTLGTLTLTCGYGGGGMPITVPHTCTIPSSVAGNTAAWFVQNPQYGAKFGDTIHVSLAVPPPKLPTNDTVDSVQLTATLPYTQGIPNAPGYPHYVADSGNLYNLEPATLHLAQKAETGANEYTATGTLVESWDGYPPDLQNANIGDTYTLTANWKAVVHYSYPSAIACPTPKDPQKQCPTTDYGTDTYQGSASTPITVNGTDYYTIATPIGY